MLWLFNFCEDQIFVDFIGFLAMKTSVVLRLWVGVLNFPGILLQTLSDIVVVPWLEINGTNEGKPLKQYRLQLLCHSISQKTSISVQQLER